MLLAPELEPALAKAAVKNVLKMGDRRSEMEISFNFIKHESVRKMELELSPHHAGIFFQPDCFGSV